MSDFRLLKKTVIESSFSEDWNNAVKEWDIVSMKENTDADSICICGNTGLRYLYEIHNNKNGNTLFPIGTTCIKQFEREDLNEEIKNYVMMFNMVSAVENNVRIELKSSFFSRRFLEYLYRKGAFIETKYNDFNSNKEYKFMLNMFNKRKVTEKQNKRITAIIINSIIPYIKNCIKN